MDIKFEKVKPEEILKIMPLFLTPKWEQITVLSTYGINNELVNILHEDGKTRSVAPIETIYRAI